MNETTMLEMLKVDLGISTNAYNDRLTQYLAVASNYIAEEGITLDDSLASDANLRIMYAAWLWRRRDTGEGMPRMLRYLLNNRLFAEKVKAE